jgi:high-affinity iron transporter
LRFRFNVQAQPPRTPSLENGGKLYAQACATCHGATGEGDGPRAHDLDPKPASFRARDRMLALPPSALFATITYGIEGTAMAAFGEAFDVAQRYDLTFFVGSLAFDDAEVARGAALTGADPDALGLRIAGLRELASQPATSLAAGGGDGLALVAYARRHPEAFENSGLALRVARERLEQSWAAYERGDAKRAAELAISAYLDGFEPVEPRIDVVRADLRARVEEDFLRYREALLGVEQRRIVAERRERLLADIAEAERALAESRFGPNAAFVAALTVLAREGFEAVLVVVALCGLLIRAGRRDALRYVHAGWIAAVVAGSATWLAARFLLDISGAEREVVEGVSSLLAACILFYVSYWLIAKVSSQRWQAFLQTRIQTALGSGSLWTLVTIAFVAVYRELFESILFFEAIAAQAGPAGLHAVFMGAAAGAVLLTALALGAFRYGLRMPVRRFFVVSSALLYALAIVLAGQGVAALQEAGLVATSRVPFVRVDWLGIHPTAETLGAQGLLVAAALLAVGWTLLRLSSGPGAATPDAAKAADCSSPRA